MLIIAFASLRVRALCEDAAQADQELGEVVAKTLRHRLADLRAATCPLDVPMGNPHQKDEQIEVMAIYLRDGFQLLYVANHVKNPLDENQRVDWRRVRRIKVVDISK
jgi:hypothetical protein